MEPSNRALMKSILNISSQSVRVRAIFMQPPWLQFPHIK